MAAPIRSGTPPHHPIYGVSLPTAHIEKITQIVLRGCNLVSVRPLESGKSFNNRIYFLTIENEQQYVLKLNGRFFGAEKIQNEVSCLDILKRWCPDIPAPRVIAWSEDGLTVAMSGKEPVRIEDNTAPGSPGWILMTRVPGEPVSSLTLNSQDMVSIGIQLADLVACWRSRVPSTFYCGNLVFHSGSDSADIYLGADGKHSNGSDIMAIRGLLDGAIRLSDPISTSVQLHGIRLRSKLADLETIETYTPNRQVGPLVSRFMHETLPHLFQDENTSSAPKFIFTSYDLAPRNVLVARLSDSELPKITGIVDFEFAGFFPAVEEFVNDFVNNGGDWPEPAYNSYLTRLQELGVGTPLGGIEQFVWKREHLLGRLLDNVAPWWLPGPFDGSELASKLAECRSIVESTIQELAVMSASL